MSAPRFLNVTHDDAERDGQDRARRKQTQDELSRKAAEAKALHALRDRKVAEHEAAGIMRLTPDGNVQQFFSCACSKPKGKSFVSEPTPIWGADQPVHLVDTVAQDLARRVEAARRPGAKR